MKLGTDPRLPILNGQDYQKNLYARLYDIFRSHAVAVNAVDDAGATNTANIATNTANIATNTANIATNTANIATNTANIATKAAEAEFTELLTNAQWYGKALGEPFWLDESLGVPLPPTDNANFRFVRLTAADSYNSGALTAESVSGSAPLVVATAQIAVGPLSGKTIHLLNTENRFIRAGVAGVLQDSQNLSHAHTPAVGGAFTTNMYPDGSRSWTFPTGPGSFEANGGATTAASGGTEARSRNIAFSLWMRIL